MLAEATLHGGAPAPAAEDRAHGHLPPSASSRASLLLVEPAAMSLAAVTAAGGNGAPVAPTNVSCTPTVRLLLHSPRPQPARVLVLAQQGGEGGSQQWEPHSPARLLCDLAVELVGGPQEVELALGAVELEGAVGADGVGVLQLALVGPEHNTVDGGDTAYPQMHFVAPPLLVLPPAAAAEVCGLWRALRKEAGLVACSAGEASRPAQAAERQSSLWWSHLAPLLGDLALVLGAGADGTDAKRVASHLLPYLYDTCMGELVGLVQCRTGAAGDSCSAQPQQAAGGSGAAGGSAGGSGVISGAFSWYALAGVLLGPGVWLAASIAVSLGVVPYFDAYVGNDRIVLLSFVQRALVLPCVQRMPVRQALTASPLLAAGEVLQLAALQPTWGWQLLLCHVALWRSGALAAAAVLEFWSRRRYAGVLRRQQAAGELSQHGSGGGSNAGLDNKDKQA